MTRAQIKFGWLMLGAMALSFCMIVAIAPAAEAPPTQGLWVTFDVQAERFRALVTEPRAVDYVLHFVAGDAPQRVPNGVVRRGGEFNSPYSWSLVPATVEFGDLTSKYCDALPSQLEENLEEWLATVERYCPWSARITSVEDCRAGTCARLKGLYAGRAPAF